MTAAEIAETQLLQRLDTGLLFHPDRPVRRLFRLAGGDHEWNLDVAPFSRLPQVDLGGDYARTPERWQVVIRWPTANGGTPVGYIFVVTVDGVDTTAIGIGPGIDGAPNWNCSRTTPLEAPAALHRRGGR